MQMPTGTGKTHVLASIVEGFTGKVLIVAHRVELVEQIKSTVDLFLAQTGSQKTQHAASLQESEFINQTSSIINHKSNIRHHKSPIKVSSIQSISRRIDSLGFEPSLVVIDEAHHALAKTYRMLWEEWPSAKFLGLTATPCRMNRAGFTDLFEVLVSSWSIAEFIRRGVLSAFDYVSIHPNSVEQQLINSLQKRGADGDYQVKEMDGVLNRQPSIERLYQSLVGFADGKKGIVYAISIDHARRIAAYYNEQGIRTAAIDSQTPKEERRQLVEDFRQGRIQVLVNVDVFSEGFDCPDVEFVQMARPTLSLSKYLQQVGRGLRKSAGKVSCMLIDNVGLCRVFGLPVQAWNWERMFRGEETGKGRTTAGEVPQTMRYGAAMVEGKEPEPDCGVGLVIGHEALMERLAELETAAETEEKTVEIKVWQDTETGLWGLRRGRKRLTEAVYVRVFGVKDQVAAVRFRNYECGLVDEQGEVMWRQDRCVSLKLLRNGLVEIRKEGGETNYLDLCNMEVYRQKPEMKVYGGFELLKVGHKCCSRTKRRYISGADFDSLVIVDKGFLLRIHETSGETWGILQGDGERFYRIHDWMGEQGAVVCDERKDYYQVTPKGEKIFLANGEEGCSCYRVTP